MTNDVGILDISSVYDFDGVDTAKPGIPQVSDPSQAAFYSRPARFVRIEKAVEIPSNKVRRIDGSAFGPAGMGMREILGYAPVQPDGSVQIQVPADVPFIVDVLDANARRITTLHTSWLQLIPGETKSCNGCHSTANKTSHGRSGLTLPVNKGAPTTSLPFPDTDPALFANAGETMAQTLARISCATGSGMTCSQILGTDVIYTPVWTQRRHLAGRVARRFAHRLRLFGRRRAVRAAPLPEHRQLRTHMDRAVPYHDSLRRQLGGNPGVPAERLGPLDAESARSTEWPTARPSA